MDLEHFVSVDRRRRRWRPKPIALVILGVGLLLVVAALVYGIFNVSRAVSVGGVSFPAFGFGNTADPTSTPTPTERYPVTWNVRLARDEDGRLIGVVDDQVVIEAVKRDFLEAWEWAFTSTVPHNSGNLERYFAPLPEGTDDPAFRPDPKWWYGLEKAREDLARETDPGILTCVLLEDGEWKVQVKRFSTDGRRAVVRGRDGL